MNEDKNENLGNLVKIEVVEKTEVDLFGWSAVLLLSNKKIATEVEAGLISYETFDALCVNDHDKLASIKYNGMEVARISYTVQPDRYYPELQLENVGVLLTGCYVMPGFRNRGIFTDIVKQLCIEYRNIALFHSNNALLEWTMKPSKGVQVVETTLTQAHSELAALCFIELEMDMDENNDITEDELRNKVMQGATQEMHENVGVVEGSGQDEGSEKIDLDLTK